MRDNDMNDRLVTVEEFRTVRMTHAAQAFAEMLDAADTPLFTDYQLFLILRNIYKNPEGLYLRRRVPSVADYRRTRDILISVKKIARDTDYFATYRVLSKQDLPADEVTCLIDPFCYISHLSAMQRYGLTDRRPEALHLTVPAPKIIKGLIQEKMEKDYEGALRTLEKNEVYPLNIVHHPAAVRKRHLAIFATVNYGRHVQIRGSCARVSTIGQTFLDMLEEPERCGGMAHILDVWKERAHSYLDEIVSAVDNAPKPIQKVRAGYILDEVMKVGRPEITRWLNHAQRGGSRVLDPSKPFINTYSEKWMLSINV